ncbi:UbiA family prenyltransferase [Limibacter armeniacum]|uniref:UbiA family prenyltransferase n=1 Tax=Limibacter armeniacum TaxID=466084 RepID=UPI002FE5981E
MNMFTKSSLLHLRVPFSFFLMPVFLFAAGSVVTIEWFNFWMAFVAIHLFLYPASNAYNSYYDRDEGSIGGLKQPPKVTQDLWLLSILFDVSAILLGLLVSLNFALMLFIYGMISKAYSYDSIRLKKYPIIGWLTVGVFQGAFTYLMTVMAVAPDQDILTLKVLIPAVLSSLLLLGSYPMTQIYQHEEDRSRGDKTISIMLGIRGTFIFTMLFFSLATAGFAWYYLNYFDRRIAAGFAVALMPVMGYFIKWAREVWKDQQKANFESTMLLNIISAVTLNTYFLLVFILNQL